MLTKDTWALTPPMGWNSWDCFGASVNEEQLLANARVMAEELKPFGWQYVVCDIQWSEPTADSCAYHPFARLTMDEYGRLLPAPNRFPSGFAAIAQKIHAMGLKFGIHIMRGVPRQAVYADCPIEGSNYTARDIAAPNHECRWNTDMYGLNTAHPGAQAYYDSLFRLYAQWGVDYVKVDDICRTDYNPRDSYDARTDVEMIRRAIDRCDRPIVLSLSPGPADVQGAWHLQQNANLWRIIDDLWDEWPLVKALFERFEVWQAFSRPGCWPDGDMLPLGTLRVFQGGEKTLLTPDEQVTLMSMWCLFRAPLMMGGDLTRLDDFTRTLLTREPVLSLLKKETPARQLRRDANEAVWQNGDTLGLFNLSDEPRTVSIFMEELRLPENRTATDLWTGEKRVFTDEIYVSLAPHACTLLALS